jgi:hypothetical protein
MVVLLQNQPRYQLMILPALICTILVVTNALLREKWVVTLLIACVTCFVFADVYLLAKIRSDTKAEQQLRAFVDEALSDLSRSARYVVVDENRGLTKLIIAQLAPASGLMVDPRYIRPENLSKVIELFEPDYLITSMVDVPAIFTPISSPEQFANQESDSQLSVFKLEKE